MDKEKNNTPQPHGIHKEETITGEGKVSNTPPGFRFTRIFPSLPPFVIKNSAALQVGAAMTSSIDRSDSEIPAGYTYFGQFVDHDITRDDTKIEADNSNTDNIEPTLDRDLIQNRSPSLDLDSLYGTPTDHGGSSPRSDGVRFDFALTSPTNNGGNSNKSLPYDLMRGVDNQGNPAVLIPDHRNDENLVVGQMHSAWMHFHNHVADAVQAHTPMINPQMLFLTAKDLVIRHYQHIVLNDFLPRFIEDGVYDDVIIKQKSKHFSATPAQIPEMPLEFSVAAYRFAHSMVRESYDWNLVFSDGGEVAAANFGRASKTGPNLSFFTFTTGGGFLRNNQPLPSNWIADWRRMFDFDQTGFDNNGVDPQMAKAIDPYLSTGMRNIPGHMPMNLAAANLRRSGLRNMPTGQDISRKMPSVKMLSSKEMTDGLDPNLKHLVELFKFDEKAPLWFYILQEANTRQGGKRLGEMGSRIVAETFLALVTASKTSIIADGWSPIDSPMRLGKGVIDTLPKMLAWVDEREPIINPLEDSRL